MEALEEAVTHLAEARERGDEPQGSPVAQGVEAAWRLAAVLPASTPPHFTFARDALRVGAHFSGVAPGVLSEALASAGRDLVHDGDEYDEGEAAALEHLYSEVALTPPLLLDVGQLETWNRELCTRGVAGLAIDGAAVVAGRVRASPPGEMHRALAALCKAYVIPEPRSPAEAVTRALDLHLDLLDLHPFRDGNGRTARLLECAAAGRWGMPLALRAVLTNHHNRERVAYYEVLGGPEPTAGRLVERDSFRRYGLAGFVVGAARVLVTQPA